MKQPLSQPKLSEITDAADGDTLLKHKQPPSQPRLVLGEVKQDWYSVK